MAAIMDTINHLSKRFDEEALIYADERTKNWFLVNNNPIYVWILTLVYIWLVFKGPDHMKNKQPWNLQWFLVVYNLGLVALSLYMFIEIVLSTYDAGYNLICAPYNEETKKDPKDLRVAKVLWWYFFSKAIELVDTVLMVLRKKNSQITFLHWFHHASMLNIWWWVMMFIPAGQSFFGAAVNCLVHVVMYAYYGLSAIPSLRAKLWWKKYLTKFQLLQFAVTITHTTQCIILPCDFPQWGKYLLFYYMIILIILFSNFYYQSYKKNKHKTRANGDTRHVPNGHGGDVNQNGVKNGSVTKGSISEKKKI